MCIHACSIKEKFQFKAFKNNKFLLKKYLYLNYMSVYTLIHIRIWVNVITCEYRNHKRCMEGKGRDHVYV